MRNPYLNAAANANYIGGVDERHEYPREYWSREQWAAEDRLRQPTYSEPCAPPPPPLAGGWFRPPSRRWSDARSTGVDRLLLELGIEPRRGR